MPLTEMTPARSITGTPKMPKLVMAARGVGTGRLISGGVGGCMQEGGRSAAAVAARAAPGHRVSKQAQAPLELRLAAAAPGATLSEQQPAAQPTTRCGHSADSREPPTEAGGTSVTVSEPSGLALANRMVGAPGLQRVGGGGLALHSGIGSAVLEATIWQCHAMPCHAMPCRCTANQVVPLDYLRRSTSTYISTHTAKELGGGGNMTAMRGGGGADLQQWSWQRSTVS